MPKRIMPLTDIQAKTAKAQLKEYKLADDGDLFLLITPTGGKLWNMKYRFEDKEKGYPLVPTLPYPLPTRDIAARMQKSLLQME